MLQVQVNQHLEALEEAARSFARTPRSSNTSLPFSRFEFEGGPSVLELLLHSNVVDVLIIESNVRQRCFLRWSSAYAIR